DHVPFVRPLVKLAATAGATAEIPGLMDEALAVAVQPHSGPTFLDFPLDIVFMEAEEGERPAVSARPDAGRPADDDQIERAAGLRRVESEQRDAEREQLEDDRAPLHPLRVYGELRQVLDRDAIVIGDGGDFVSYAGRVIDSYEPGCWLDPGPFGCLGSGPGYALAAKLARPDKQVVLLLGDGAFGFSAMEFDTLARHGVNVVGVLGNNGIW